MALIIKLRIDNSTREFELFSASEMDSLLDRLFCGKVNNQPAKCEKVKVPVTQHTIRHTPIKYGVQPRKIGCSRPASMLQRWGSGRARGRPSSHSPNLGLGGRSKGLATTIDLGHQDGHALHYVASAKTSASQKSPGTPLRHFVPHIPFDGGGLHPTFC